MTFATDCLDVLMDTNLLGEETEEKEEEEEEEEDYQSRDEEGQVEEASQPRVRVGEEGW